MSQQILQAGLLAMFCVALGMGLTTTTTIFAPLAITSRHSLMHLMHRHEKVFAVSHAVLSVGGAVIITGIGSLLLIGQG